MTDQPARPRLRTVEEFEDLIPPALTRDEAIGLLPERHRDPAAAKIASAATAAATSMLLLAIKSLSQKTVVALATLFTLLTAASVFAIAFVISTNPSTLQLVLLGIYSVFVLCLNFVRRN